ncbi:serine/threonine-protein kinase crk1 [Mytilinidion resinicola]|uniref:Serine/threonine-protein kinase crk1 n=1 Tax=Mytilinidion resinicola TaxID=574789 RepID=A0A6A6YQH6_9PEZI|nr:serine/threonine-protein kinase crk1 [Mytilinidion resinicola]KAF2810264.1 serine/threonine-protein kinase crk1 [Mytilinidion resinicola]
MALSPIDSPKPVPAAAKALPAKAKALTILNASTSSPSNASTPSSEGPQDLSEQLNEQVRRNYVTGSRLGEGTYAIVYSGHLRHDPTSLVAIKKLKVNKDYLDGLAPDAFREVRALQELSHPNIIKLYAVFSTRDQNLNIVLEHLPRGDIEGLMQNKSVSYGPADVKAWANMLAKAVWFCHENSILHRDIKGNNLLIAADGEVKLADFGLARTFSDPYRPMTYNVITRFYRPPELLYGARYYGGAVDVWSMGCVIAELVLRHFFLVSNTDIEQIDAITDVFGSCTEDVWPGVSRLDHYIPPAKDNIKRPKPMIYWKQHFGMLGDDGIEYLKSMFVLDPRKRATARQVLDHPYWTNNPKPTPKELLPQAAGGVEKMAEDLKRRGGEIEEGDGRADKVARKLNFADLKR